MFDVKAPWRPEASDVAGEALRCGHLIPEAVPDAPLATLKPFLAPS